MILTTKHQDPPNKISPGMLRSARMGRGVVIKGHLLEYRNTVVRRGDERIVSIS